MWEKVLFPLVAEYGYYLAMLDKLLNMDSC